MKHYHIDLVFLVFWSNQVSFANLCHLFMPHVFPRASQSKHTGAFSLLHMCLTILEQALPDECLAQQEFNVLLRPTLSWKCLQEHHDLLEIHFAELVGPFDEEGGAYV